MPIADKKPGNSLYPADLRLRAEVNKWLFWDAAHLQFEATFPLYMERMFRPMRHLPARPEFHAVADENFKRFAAVVNGAIEGKKYLVGDRFTLANLAIVGTLMHREVAKIDLAAYPHLKAYLAQHEQRESWKRTAPPPMG